MALLRSLRIVAERHKDSPALSWRTTRWTYSDLLAALASVERALERAGAPPGARIALLMRNSPHYVACYYGALSRGCVAVPLNVQERASVLARQIEDGQCSLVIGDAAHPEWGKLADAIKGATRVVAVRLEQPEALRALDAQLASGYAGAWRATDADRAAAAAGAASIIYTSGTTGRPKGVVLSERNLEANAQAIIESLGLASRDHSLCVLPFHFSYGNSVLHSHLLCGARLTLEDNFAFPQVMLERLRDERVSGFAGVPSTFALLLGRHRLADFDLSNLRYVTQAGGPMPRPLLDKLRGELPHASVFVMYGQTEATARITCLPPEDLDRKAGSVGVPIRGVEIEIREAGARVAPGAVGGVFVRGPNVMQGYWNDAAATGEVLRDGWLHTRDLGYLDGDGYLYIVGRSSDMIKVGAFRVSPLEIEEVIAALDGVEEAAVAGVPDDVLGQAIKAVIVLRPGATLTPMAVKAHCRENLAGYKVPKAVEFVAKLPRTSSGKVQRFKLAGAQSEDEEEY